MSNIKYKPADKKGQLKKAIKMLGKKRGLTPRTYYKLSNYEILVFMLEQRIGVQWITEGSINKLRQGFPLMYREKNID